MFPYTGMFPSPMAQLAELAYIYYDEMAPGTVVPVWSKTSPLENTTLVEFIDSGLVELRDCEIESVAVAGLTSKGKAFLLRHPPMDIILALQKIPAVVPIEFYVKMLPKEDLPVFFTHNLEFIRQAAQDRFEELTRLEKDERNK